jgi:hypothetical protein
MSGFSIKREVWRGKFKKFAGERAREALFSARYYAGITLFAENLKTTSKRNATLFL